MISAILFSKPSRRSLEYGRLSGSLQTLSSVSSAAAATPASNSTPAARAVVILRILPLPSRVAVGSPRHRPIGRRRREPYGDYSIANTCSEPPRVVALSRPAP